MKLFFAPGSCAFAALTAFETAGADYEAWRLDLAKGDQRSPQFLAINPLGRVPALMIDGTIVTELLAVMNYIDARFPEAGLLSRDPLARAREMQLLSWFSTSIHIHIAQIFRGERFSADLDVQAKLKADGLTRFSEELEGIEAACSGASPAIRADRFTLVNAFGLVIWRWAEKLQMDTSRFPDWSRIAAADFTRPAVLRAKALEASAPLWIGRSADTLS